MVSIIAPTGVGGRKWRETLKSRINEFKPGTNHWFKSCRCKFMQNRFMFLWIENIGINILDWRGSRLQSKKHQLQRFEGQRGWECNFRDEVPPNDSLPRVSYSTFRWTRATPSSRSPASCATLLRLQAELQAESRQPLEHLSWMWMLWPARLGNIRRLKMCTCVAVAQNLDRKMHDWNRNTEYGESCYPLDALIWSI